MTHNPSVDVCRSETQPLSSGIPTKAPLPDPEIQRLEALHQYNILDTEPEAAFDEIARLAAQICGTPVAGIGFLDANRYWFKSTVEFTLKEIPRELTFCQYTILEDDLLVIRDTLADERFASNPLVNADPPIRFYAGAPLRTPDGLALGTLCVIDSIPRKLNAKQRDGLKILSQQAIAQLQLRRQLVELTRAHIERQQAEENLRIYADIFKNVQIGLIVWQLENMEDVESFRLVAYNPAALQVTGVAAGIWENSLGKRMAESTPGLLKTEIPQIYAEVVRSQTARDLGEIRYKDRHIPESVFAVKAFPLPNNCVGVALENVSDRKHMEEALRESEERYRQLVELSPNGIFIQCGQDFAFLNSAALAIYGAPNPEALIGKPVIDFVHPNYKQVVKERIRQLIKGNKPTSLMEQKLLRCDGTSIDVEIAATPFVYQGQPGAQVVINDITQRKQAEQKIREQAALLDVATDAIMVRSLEGKILFWNKGAEQLYGWAVSEAIGKNANHLLYKNSASQLTEVGRILREKGEWRGELHQITKSGKEIIVASRWTFVPGESGQPKSILVVNTDITEKKTLEIQFLRAQRMESIGVLAGGIAHDLNNMLTPILIAVQTLKKLFEDERSQRLLSTLELNAKRGADLVKQVLSFARGLEGAYMTLQIGHLIQDIEKIIKEIFPKSIQIETDIPTKELWTVSGDATLVHQVLMNLCVNARDAMPNGGTLSITAQNIYIDENFARMNIDAKVGPYVAIAVSDTGMGIPPEVFDRMFEPFFTTKDLGKGTGLGLSTVLGIVKSHNGFINVYSEVGKGTQFKVYLPALESTETAQAIEEHRQLPAGNGELILVVDDEASICEITQTSLETYGYRVLTASDGIEAIAVYVEHQSEIRVVVIDMMMPAMDGSVTIRTLQKINPDIKILAVSGLASNSKLTQLGERNVKAFLAKPYTSEDLLRTLYEVLNGHEV